MAYQKVLRSIAVAAVFSIVISVVLVGAGESRLSAAGLDGNRSADIMEIVGGYGLKLSCFVVVACSIALAFISRTRAMSVVRLTHGIAHGPDFARHDHARLGASLLDDDSHLSGVQFCCFRRRVSHCGGWSCIPTIGVASGSYEEETRGVEGVHPRVKQSPRRQRIPFTRDFPAKEGLRLLPDCNTNWI